MNAMMCRIRESKFILPRTWKVFGFLYIAGWAVRDLRKWPEDPDRILYMYGADAWIKHVLVPELLDSV